MISPVGSGASTGRLRSAPSAFQRRDRMPAERTTMRQVREVLRLKFVGGVPIREIARRIGVAAATVRVTLKRFQTAELSWPLPEELTDAALEAKLFADAGTKQGHRRQVEPDWTAIHRELKRKHVTLSILWDEYIERHSQGYRYSRFCELYRSWEAKLSVTMRQTHVGGDKLFVDYAGDTVPVIVDRLTGEVRQAQIFVAVMGASSFTYVEATWTQALGDRIGAHTAGRPASAKVGSRQPSATYRCQRAMGVDCSRSPRATDKAPVTAKAGRSQRSWCGPLRQALHRFGCADCAAVSARHRTRLARHRAPRTTNPPARSPGASQRNRISRRFLREVGRDFRMSRSAFSLVTSRLRRAISSCSGFIWPWPGNACSGSSANFFTQSRNCDTCTLRSCDACTYDTPRSLIRRTASSLKSRVNFRISMTHLQLHQNT